MGKSRCTPKQMIDKLLQAEIEFAKGATVSEACSNLGVSEKTYYLWRQVYGGLGMGEVKRLKRLEEETMCLKRQVAELNADKSILEEIIPKYFAEPEAKAALNTSEGSLLFDPFFPLSSTGVVTSFQEKVRRWTMVRDGNLPERRSHHRYRWETPVSISVLIPEGKGRMRRFSCRSAEASCKGLGVITEELTRGLACRILGWELPIGLAFKHPHSGDPISLTGSVTRIHFDMADSSGESRQARLGVAIDVSEESGWRAYRDIIQRFEDA